MNSATNNNKLNNNKNNKNKRRSTSASRRRADKRKKKNKEEEEEETPMAVAIPPQQQPRTSTSTTKTHNQNDDEDDGDKEGVDEDDDNIHDSKTKTMMKGKSTTTTVMKTTRTKKGTTTTISRRPRLSSDSSNTTPPPTGFGGKKEESLSSSSASSFSEGRAGIPMEVSFESSLDGNDEDDNNDTTTSSSKSSSVTVTQKKFNRPPKEGKGSKSKRSSRALGDLDVNAPAAQASSSSSLKQVAKLSQGQTAISAAAIAAQQLAATKQQLAALVAARGLVATTTGTAETAATVMAAEEKKEKERDWKSIQKELDDLFLKTSSERMNGVPHIRMPQILSENGVELYQHQMDGIRWLTHKEKGQSGIPPYYKERYYGFNKKPHYRCTLQTSGTSSMIPPPPLTHSILADDMGLGKTLESIGLILANPPPFDGAKVYPYKKPKGRAAAEEARTTLIVGPVSVLANWKMEIDKFVNKKKSILKVAIYAGKDRAKVLWKVQDGELDILICSYQTLSSDWRKKIEAEMEEEEQQKENDDDVSMADEEETRCSRKHPTRKITKKSYANGGAGNDSDEDEDASHTGSDYESEFEESDDESSQGSDEDWVGDDEEEPCIFDQVFHRIILDEAHTIRNSKTAYFASTNAIQATHKLCITGTPFINHPRDIHSFLSFLNVSPLDDIQTFNKEVVAPIEQRKEIGLSRLRVVMSALAIRRTKAEVKKEVYLKEKTVEIREVPFPDDDPHQEVSEMLYHTCRNAFLALIQDGNQTFGRKQFQLFGLVLRVRQACASCDLIPRYYIDEIAKLWESMQNVDVEALSGDEGKELFDSIVQALQKVNKKSRALKQENSETESSYESDGDDDSVLSLQDTEEKEIISYGRSPKIQALMDAIGEMKEGEKGVIFSQWTGFLNIIAKELEYEGHSFTHLNGKMDAYARIESMGQFSKDHGGPRFILCSLMACGTGITLTRGNHVYVMDCWWNRASEDQAMDRVHRIGQTRKVRAIRFIMKDSIEERFINVQDAKHSLGKGSLQKLKKDDRSKARITAMKDLFQMDCDAKKWEGMYDDDEDFDDDGSDLKDFIVDDDDDDVY